MSNGRTIGIDLGTTFSSVAYVDTGGHVVCLPNRDGQTLTPSAVLLNDDGTFEVGDAARRALTTQPDRVAVAFKRRMGKTDEPFTLGDRTLSAVELSALVLRRLVEDAQRAIGPVAGAVITVPAYFGDRERTATLQAAEQAGVRVIDVLNEPTSAALAYAFDAYIQAGGDAADLQTASIAATAPAVSVVCDLGGGTFDVTIIRINGHTFDVLATGGSLTLGGRDWDERIVDALERHILNQAGPDPHYDPRARARMMLDAEAAKHVLTVKSEVMVPAPYPQVGPMRLAREGFEEMTRGLADRMEETIFQTLADADLTWAQIEDVLLVGGSTRMPHVRQRIARLSGKSPNTRLQPDLAVAQGAAVYAAILQVQGAASAAAGLDLPAAGEAAEPSAEDTACGSDPFENPFDEAFSQAAGAVRLTQVNSRALGVIVRSPRYDKLVNAVVIPRNSSLPAQRTRRFVTRQADQRRIRIPIVEGELRDPVQTVEIGQCVIDPLPAGLPAGTQVQVTFSYDSTGRVRVRAEVPSAGLSAQTVLQRPSGRAANQLDELAQAVAQLAGA